jgi:hypothetical protein
MLIQSWLTTQEVRPTLKLVTWFATVSFGSSLAAGRQSVFKPGATGAGIEELLDRQDNLIGLTRAQSSICLPR